MWTAGFRRSWRGRSRGSICKIENKTRHSASDPIAEVARLHARWQGHVRPKRVPHHHALGDAEVTKWTQNVFYAALGTASALIVTLGGNGTLHEWFGLASAKWLFILAVVLSGIVCQHALLLALVELARMQVAPVVGLLQCSRPAIRAILHLTAVTIFASGIVLGWLLASNTILSVSLGLSLIVSSASEWTFFAGLGPLSTFLIKRDCKCITREDGS